MTDLETVHITFTCLHCGSVNELTANHLHDATVIHCSRCRTAVGPLAFLRDHPAPDYRAELLRA